MFDTDYLLLDIDQLFVDVELALNTYYTSLFVTINSRSGCTGLYSASRIAPRPGRLLRKASLSPPAFGVHLCASTVISAGATAIGTG